MPYRKIITLLFLGLLSACASTDLKQGEFYESELQALMGYGRAPLDAKLTDEWAFVLKHSWQAESPDPTAVNASIPDKIDFLENVAAEIFQDPGSYHVLVYTRFLRAGTGSDAMTDRTGAVTGTYQTYDLVQRCCIRMVFRDDKMIHFRVWPKIVM